MDGAEKRQDLSQRKKELLAAMGIQVWYSRRTDAQLNEQHRQQTNAHATAAAEPIRVPAQEPNIQQNPEQALSNPAQLAREAANVKLDPAPDATRVVAAEETASVVEVGSVSSEPAAQIIEFNWIKAGQAMLVLAPESDGAVLQLAKDIVTAMSWQREPGTKTTLASGEFRWPQLLDTSGTPTRALKVFLAKHVDAEQAILGISAELKAELEPWLEELKLTTVVLPSLRQHLADPTVKRDLWQTLLNLA